MKIRFLRILAIMVVTYLVRANTRCEENVSGANLCLETWHLKHLSLPESKIDTHSVALSDSAAKSLFICARNECGTGDNCFWSILHASRGKCAEIGLLEGFPHIDKTKHNGFCDIATTWHISASEYVASLYQFEPNQYREVQSYDCLIDVRGNQVKIPIQRGTNDAGSSAKIVRSDSACIEIENVHFRPGAFRDLIVLVPDDCGKTNKNDGSSYLFTQSITGYVRVGCIPGLPRIRTSMKNGYFELESVDKEKGTKQIYLYDGKAYVRSPTKE
jgi:hypothetical protein